MSIWTHCTISFRVDGMPGEPFNDSYPDLGNICKFEDSEEVWKKCNVPCGSEGSLQYSIVEYFGGLPWLACHIWGDLRDYDNIQEIIDYVRRVCGGKSIRDGVGLIEVEYNNPVIIVYDLEKKVWNVKE